MHLPSSNVTGTIDSVRSTKAAAAGAASGVAAGASVFAAGAAAFSAAGVPDDGFFGLAASSF